MSITGEEDGKPCKVGVAVTDLMTGLYAHGAIMAALLSRGKTGKGQHINCSLFNCQLASLANIGSNYLVGGMDGKRWGTAHESIVPYQGFPTSDGEIVIAAGNDTQFARFCSAMGQDALAADPNYQSNAMRVKNRGKLVGEISSILKCEPTSHWMKKFGPRGVDLPCAPINSIQQVFELPDAQRLVKKVEHPTSGSVQLVGPPIAFSDTSPSVRTPPPLLGQHTFAVLTGVLGFSTQQIEELATKGVVDCLPR